MNDRRKNENRRDFPIKEVYCCDGDLMIDRVEEQRKQYDRRGSAKREKDLAIWLVNQYETKEWHEASANDKAKAILQFLG